MSPEETEAIETLKELVRLRKLHDRIDDGGASRLDIQRYHKEKILAWHRAFLAVARL
jgi:hypothetical protein